jgi:hypothetical protein
MGTPEAVLFELTGRKVFSLLGLKPSRYFNVPVGLVAWFVFGRGIMAIMASVLARRRDDRPHSQCGISSNCGMSSGLFHFKRRLMNISSFGAIRLG